MGRRRDRLRALLGTLMVTAIHETALGQPGDDPAEEYNVGEVTITATRREQEIFDTPTPTTVITREQIARQSAVDVGEILEDAIGVDVADDGVFRGRPVIRGLDSNRVLILVDGLRVSNPRVLTGFGGVQPTIDPQEIERIEIVRGPASVLYGSDALGGVVNIITRPPSFTGALDASPALRFAYGTAGNRREAMAGVDVGAPSLAGSLRVTGREADDYHSPSGRIPNSDATTGSVTPRLRYRFDNGWIAGLDGEIFRAADVGIPVAEEDRAIFDGEFRRDDRDRVALRLEAPRTAGLFRSVNGAVFYQRQKRNFTFTVNVEDDGGTPNDPNDDVDVFVFDDTTSSIETIGTNLVSQWSFPAGVPGLAGHEVSAGLDFFQDSISDDTFNLTDVFVGPGAVLDGVGLPNVDTPLPIPRGPGLVDERTESNASSVPDAVGRSVAAFVQDEMLLPWKVSLFVGGRVDGLFFDADASGDESARDETAVAPSGAAGVVVPIVPWLHGVANLARGFRAPNLAERYFSGPGTTGGVIVPNPDLDPETSLNLDAGFKVGHRRLSAAITYFRSDVKDLIRIVGTDQEETFTFVNVEDVLLQGVELSGEWRLSGAFTLGMNFAYTDEKTSVGDVVAVTPTVAPPANGTLIARYQPPRIQSALVDLAFPYFELRGRLVDDFDDLRGRRRDGYLALAARTGGRIGTRFGDVRLDVGLENLTDEAYVPAFGAAEAPGRNLTAAVAWRF